MNEIYEENHLCPECVAHGESPFGRLHYPPVRGCSCHLNPPCSACVDNKLTCRKCGWEWEPPERIEVSTDIPGISTYRYTKRKIHVFANGSRIFDYDYNSSSGSTMVWTGKYEGDVTAGDIIEHFGRGTFGQRGPYLSNGRFTYTKITD